MVLRAGPEGGSVAKAQTSDPLVSELKDRGSHVATATAGHEFVRRIADGSLSGLAFLHYLLQNALFLTGYAAALREALLIDASPPGAELIATLQASISGPALQRHRREYQARTGRDPLLDAARQAVVTTAYVDHLRDSARLGVPGMIAAILPGEQSYAAAGRYYRAEGDLTPANPYADWIRQYTGGHVDLLVDDLVEAIAAAAPVRPPRDQMLSVYDRAAELDGQFWEMVARPEAA
jgi:thiaminase